MPPIFNYSYGFGFHSHHPGMYMRRRAMLPFASNYGYMSIGNMLSHGYGYGYGYGYRGMNYGYMGGYGFRGASAFLQGFRFGLINTITSYLTSRRQARADEQARLRAEEEARRKADADAKRKADADAKRKADEDAKRLADEEARRKAEEDARIKAEEDARRKAEEDARIKAEEDARRKAEEDARIKAEEEARRKAEEDARIKAEEEARRKAETDGKNNKPNDVKPVDKPSDTKKPNGNNTGIKPENAITNVLTGKTIDKTKQYRLNFEVKTWLDGYVEAFVAAPDGKVYYASSRGIKNNTIAVMESLSQQLKEVGGFTNVILQNIACNLTSDGSPVDDNTYDKTTEKPDYNKHYNFTVKMSNHRNRTMAQNVGAAAVTTPDGKLITVEDRMHNSYNTSSEALTDSLASQLVDALVAAGYKDFTLKNNTFGIDKSYKASK